MKLGLGTAQFGFDYGVVNRRGRISVVEVQRILALAEQWDVDLIDTAPAYGDSEHAISAALAKNHHFRIVTKTPNFREVSAIGARHALELKTTCYRSLERLGTGRVYALLLHNVDTLRLPGGHLLAEAMHDLLKEGLVDKLGVSLYDGEQIDHVLSVFKPDVVQCPVNVFDQRLLATGHLARMHQLGVEVHARSIFLQGLLLLPSLEDLPAYFWRWRAHFARYFNYLAEKHVDKVTAALSFVIHQPEVAVVLVGVSCLRDFEEIVASARSVGGGVPELSQFAIEDPMLVNPSLWNLAGPQFTVATPLPH